MTRTRAPAAPPPPPPPPPRKSAMDQIKEAGTLLKAVGGILAALPALAVITGLVDIPPTLSQLVKMVTVPISIFIVLGVIVLSDSIRAMSAKRAVLIFGTCILLGAAAAVQYYNFGQRHVVEVMDGERLVIPFKPSPAINEIMADYGGDYAEALINGQRSGELRRLMEAERGWVVAVMVLLMVLAQVLLVAGMIGGLWKVVLDQTTEAKGPPAV